jgi:CubicO group peptidase (beta-lactamase class C family)
MTVKLNRRHVLLGAVAAASSTSVPAFARKPKRMAKRIVTGTGSWAGVQASLDQWVAKSYIPGAGAALARGTQQASFLTSGTLAHTSTVAITPDSLWRVYSMTKPITGMAAMLLIEDGKMSLNQNIADFLPAFAAMRVLSDGESSLASRPALAPISVRCLLTHTAGLGYSIVTKGALLKEYERLGITPAQATRKHFPGQDKAAPTAPSLAEFADRLATLPLIADPGVKWSYSVSLDLLGRVIEVASGMSFDAFIQQRILDPLGMTSTYWQVPAAETYRLTTNYFKTPLKTIELDPGSDSVYSGKPAFPFGGSGLVSSMRDYDRFLAMLMGLGALGETRIMTEATARTAMSNLVHPDTRMDSFVTGQGFGAGGRVTINPSQIGEGIGTFGWGGAASTIGWVDPTRGIRASGWAQIMTGEVQPFTTDFSKTVYASL